MRPRRPVSATASHPIPPLAEIASAFAVSALLAGAAACKKTAPAAPSESDEFDKYHENYGGKGPSIPVHDASTASSGVPGTFDPAAANASLADAERDVASCAQPGGPSGHGHARVTFAPSGAPAAAALSAPFSGTHVGQCVGSRLESAHVPPFRGDLQVVVVAFEVPRPQTGK